MLDAAFSALLDQGLIAFLFSITLWWMVTRYEKLIISLREMMTIQNLMILGLQKELLAHDLTVSGINPATGDDPEERGLKAYNKYNELHHTFKDIEEHIKRIADKEV